MNNEETPEPKRSNKRKFAYLFIAVAVLGTGIGLYSCSKDSQPHHDKSSLKMNIKSKNVRKSGKSSGFVEKKADKTKKDATKDVLNEALGSSSQSGQTIDDIIQTALGGNGDTDDGLAVLGGDLDNQIAAADALLTSGKTNKLVALADQAVKEDTPTTDTSIVDTNTNSTSGGDSNTGSNGGTAGTTDDGGNTGSGTDTPVTPPISGNTNMRPILQVPGNKTVVAGSAFDPFDGVNAYDAEDGDLNGGVVVDGKLDTDKPGTYNLTYSVSDSQGREVMASRTITVINTAPTLGNSSSNQIDIGSNFDPMAGIKSSDKQDGNLTDKVKVAGSVDTSKAGTYELTYTVTDANGTTSTLHRKVTVAIRDAEFSGVSDTTIEAGTSFDVNEGVSVADNYDETNTAFSVDGTINPAKLGKQVLTYSHTDKWGHTTSATRTITVTPEKPELTVDDFTVAVGADAALQSHATATSKYGDATVTTTGDVDTTQPGIYEVKFTATDKFKQTVTKTVTVTVE